MNAQSIIPGVGRLHSLSRTPTSTAFVPIVPASLPCLVALLATAFTARPAQAQAVLLVASNPGNGTVGKYDAVTGAAINVPFFSPPQMGSHEMVFDQHNHLFVSGSGTVGEYNATTGATINATFITGLDFAPQALALDGNNHLFLSDPGTQDIVGEYNATTGATINASFIHLLDSPQGLQNSRGLAVDNKNHLFVSSYQSNTVGEYDTTTGATINADFINGQGLRNPDVLLLDGLNHLFVGDNHDTTTVGEYDATTGATINAAFVPDAPGNGTYALALDGSDHLFVAGIDGGVSEYDATTGAIINEHLNALNDISGLTVIASVPEPSTLVLAALGVFGLAGRGWRRRATRQAMASGLVAAFVGAAALCTIPGTARGQIFIANSSSGAMSEYTGAGTSVNANLISGLNGPVGIAVSGANIFVLNYGTSTDGNYDPASGSIGEYTTSGATINAALITGLQGPQSIAVSGSNLFVTNYYTGTIGEYTTSGATVNASLITGLDQPLGVAASGGNLFVTNYSTSATIAEYTTAGATVNPALVSDLYIPYCIAASGPNLFTRSSFGGGDTIGEYDATTGATVNANLFSGLNGVPVGIAISGANMFVLSEGDNPNDNTIGEYTTSGATVNASLITQLDRSASAIAVVPEPSCVALATLGFIVLLARRRRGLMAGVLIAAATLVVPQARADVADAWGYNVFGQLGDGTTNTRSTSVPVT